MRSKYGIVSVKLRDVAIAESSPTWWRSELSYWAIGTSIRSIIPLSPPPLFS